MNPLVIYHASCTDGFGAAFAAWLKLGDEAEYVPMQYGPEAKNHFWRNDDGTFDSDLTILNREIYILDFSFDRWIMEGLFSLAKRVTWLDHHKTAFEMWCGGIPKKEWHEERRNCTDDNPGGTIHVTLDNNKSGALLSWEYFHPYTEVPLLIQHIDDRDRWIFALDGSKELHAALQSYKPWDFEMWKEICERATKTCGDEFAGHLFYERILAEGAAILRAQDAAVMSMVKRARKCWVKAPQPIDLPGSFIDGVVQGWQGLACNTPLHQSELGHELANQSGTFGLCYYIAEDNKVRCSFRSNGDYDVSAICKAFGGGGHKNAAGCEVSIETLLSWLS